MSDLETPGVTRIIEAMLFASAEPLSKAAIAEKFPECDVDAALLELQNFYQGRGVELKEINGRYRFQTATDVAPHLRTEMHVARKLPRAAAETMAIIAYHQPVTRAEIEAIRAVEVSRGTLDILMEIGWIQPGERRETPGRPVTWKTTQKFLEHFNLTSVKDLPGIEELKAAGLLDARPVLAALTPEKDETPSDEGVADDEEDYDFLPSADLDPAEDDAIKTDAA